MAGFIEGVDRGQSLLFPDRLKDWIGENSLVRVVDLFVDERNLTHPGFARSSPARTGRPGYHPAVLRKLFTYGYLNRIPSGRRLRKPLAGAICMSNAFAAGSLPSSSGTSSASPVAILPMCTAKPIASAGRFSPFGHLGIPDHFLRFSTDGANIGRAREPWLISQNDGLAVRMLPDNQPKIRSRCNRRRSPALATDERRCSRTFPF
jgi:hypothetical protein